MIGDRIGGGGEQIKSIMISRLPFLNMDEMRS
jgi:hypothetical protein